VNERLKYTVDWQRDEETAAVRAKKDEILHSILADPNGSVSQLELLAQTPTDNHPDVHIALSNLQASGIITEQLFQSESNSVVNCYGLDWQLPDTTTTSVSAHEGIRNVLDELSVRIERGTINSLNAEEWCMRTILTYADRAIRSGRLVIPILAIGQRMVEDLKDEGIEKWFVAYKNAAEQATQLFEIHPESV
jgi:hypothetical protein